MPVCRWAYTLLLIILTLPSSSVLILARRLIWLRVVVRLWSLYLSLLSRMNPLWSLLAHVTSVLWTFCQLNAFLVCPDSHRLHSLLLLLVRSPGLRKWSHIIMGLLPGAQGSTSWNSSSITPATSLHWAKSALSLAVLGLSLRLIDGIMSARFLHGSCSVFKLLLIGVFIIRNVWCYLLSCLLMLIWLSSFMSLEFRMKGSKLWFWLCWPRLLGRLLCLAAAYLLAIRLSLLLFTWGGGRCLLRGLLLMLNRASWLLRVWMATWLLDAHLTEFLLAL